MTGIQVKIVSGSSAEVSWKELDITGISKYVVTYSNLETNTDESKEVQVLAPESSVLINGLSTNKEYQFQVHAVAVISDQTVLGSKSIPLNITLKAKTQSGRQVYENMTDGNSPSYATLGHQDINTHKIKSPKL